MKDQPSRRDVLRAGSAALLAGAIVPSLSACNSSSSSNAPVTAAPVTLPTPSSTATLPANAQFDVPGLGPIRTPQADLFQIDIGNGVPAIDPAKWRLRIHGMVDHEVTIGWSDLIAGNVRESDITLSCVSNSVGGDLIGSAAWTGVPIVDFLTKAGPAAGADMVLCTGADGWTTSTPLESLLNKENPGLLAFAINGQPLTAPHGAPVRMIVPGLYGFVSATKWVTEMKVTRYSDDTAYWSTRGWSSKGPIKMASRIVTPRRGQKVAAGPVVVAGTAWSPAGIKSVELKVDDGAWQMCELTAPIGPMVWRQWRTTWQATAGKHELTVRAVDGNGVIQTDKVADSAPDGATGWHSISVKVA